MRHPRARRFPAALQAAALTISLLAGGAYRGGHRLGRDGAGGAGGGLRDGSGAQKELRALEASFKGRIGAYALDTATGKTVAYRSGERFPLLSTFKAWRPPPCCTRPAPRTRA